jgi:hypothetical protein
VPACTAREFADKVAAMKSFGPTRVALSFVEKVLDRVLCVVGAVLFSQMPEYMQQYLQRLGGHLAQAQRDLQRFRDVAVKSGQTLDQLIQSFRASSDAAVAKTAGVIEATAEQVADLAAAEHALRTATPWTRPWAFFRHLDSGIAGDTWSVFQPAVPTTFEGLMYAAAGVLVALALYHGFIRYPVAQAIERRRLARASTLAPARP